MAKKFKVMASNAKKPDGKCIPKSMRKSIESACGKKKAVKASDSESKFRIDIFKKDNPDALVKREFKMFKSEDEAKKYGESIANGNIVNVMEVQASCTKKSVKSSKGLTVPKSKRKTVKASSSAKRRVGKKSIKASSPNGYSRDERFALAGEVLYRAGIANQEHGAAVAYYLPGNYVLTFNSANDEMQSPDLIFTIWNPNAKDEFDYVGILYTDLNAANRGTDATEALFNKGMGSLPEREEFSNTDDAFRKALDWVLMQARDYKSDRVWELQHGVESSKSVKKFGIKASSDGWKETDYSVFMDGGRQLMSKYTKEFDGYRVMILPEYNAKTDILSWVVFLFDVDEEPRRLEAFETAYDAKDFADYEVYEGYVKPVNSSKSVKKFGIKASKSAKKRKAIKASDNYYDEDIVFYFNGKKQFEGSIFDLAGTVEILCHDPKVMQVFQDYCNQFGDPIDFDGTPRDTAVTFTKMVMFEAEEANEPSDFYVEYSDYRNPIGGFEVFYANEGIYSAKSIKCTQGDFTDDFSEDEFPFRVTSYYDHSQRGIADGASFDDMDEAVAYAHEKLSEGSVRIEHYDVGAVDINPDEYWENFDGEFWCTPELAEWRDEVWKSMGIDASKSIKCSDSDGTADEWEDIREISEQGYEYTGGTDDDMLEYVDEYLNDVEAWLNTDYVKYVSPDDWVVDASLSDEAVASDFYNFVDLYFEGRDMDIDLYEINTNGIQGNDFFISFYPMNKQFSAPQIELDEYYLTKKEFDTLSRLIPIYEKRRIGMYKAMQNGLGEYLSGIASKINSSKDIKCGITVGQDDRYDFSNPIYELDDYVKALADGVVNQIQGITYDISKETIAFFDEDNNVVFVQPIGGIIPEPEDLETDIYELSEAIQHADEEATWRELAEAEFDAHYEYDPDYATRAIELSTDVKAAEETVDIDDLEYVTGEDDEPADMGYGFDSNGDPIDESTVEELYRIAEYEILPKSELAKIDEYVSIDEDSWDFYMSSPHVTEKFYIHFKLTEKDINFNDYALPDGKMFPDFNYYTAVLDFDIYAENGEITSVILEDKKIYRPDGAFDDYDVKQFDDLYNVEALINYVEHLAADTVKDIYNGTTNI